LFAIADPFDGGGDAFVASLHDAKASNLGSAVDIKRPHGLSLPEVRVIRYGENGAAVSSLLVTHPD
jgi:hypothetical protein